MKIKREADISTSNIFLDLDFFALLSLEMLTATVTNQNCFYKEI